MQQGQLVFKGNFANLAGDASRFDERRATIQYITVVLDGQFALAVIADTAVECLDASFGQF